MAVLARASGLALACTNMGLLVAVGGLLTASAVVAMAGLLTGTALSLSSIFLAKSSKHSDMVRKGVSG